MKALSLFRTLLLFTSCCLLSACSDDDAPVLSHLDPIVLEGEGGESVIDIGYDDFTVTSVFNTTGGGEQRIFGETYSPDGKLISENMPLSLEGLGRIQSVWDDQGFIIERSEPSRLKLTVIENSRPEEFTFAIVLQAGEEIRKIDIQQKKSEGYTFDKIEYSIEPGDRDSLYMQKGITYKYNLISPQKINISVFDGIDFIRTQVFESKDAGAFVWTEQDKPLVQVPESVYDGYIYYADEKAEYTAFSQRTRPDLDDLRLILEIPAGGYSFSNYVEIRRRTITYTLTLINNRTKDTKTVKGKWIETTPTGDFEIREIK